MRFVAFIFRSFIWLATLLFAAWAFGALWFDFPRRSHDVATGFGVVLLVLLVAARGSLARAFAWIVAASVVLAWWLTLQPRADRQWQPDVAQTAWAEIDGDTVTLHNVRHCEYRSPTDYTPHWGVRTVRLSQLTGIDFAIAYWGSPYMAHPIASFQFADAPPVCFSIETRKEVGESYSAIGGFYRQYELIYVAAEETDVLRLRTNYRKGEDVFLYRLHISPEKARERFMDYISTLNELHRSPRWYNAATTNCTTSIRDQHAVSERAPWDWRMLVNGFGDQLMYERGAFVTDGLSFPELRARALINPAAHVSPLPEFSTRIREGRPGFARFTVPPPPGTP